MKNINKYLKSSLVLAAFVYSVGTTIPIQSTYADEINAELVNNETIKEWKPEGKVIETGEDGVPWELYENGYLLFKPELGKEILSKVDSEGHFEATKLFGYLGTEESKEFKDKIKAIGFKGKTYLPGYPPNLFMNFKNLEFFDGENLDLSKTDSLWDLFLNDEKLNNVKLENWNVSHIKRFIEMFAGTSIRKLDLSKWNFSETPDSTKRGLLGSMNVLDELVLPESFFNLTERDKNEFEENNSVDTITYMRTDGPEAYKNKVYNDKWVRKEDKKEINDFTELKITDKSNAGTWTRKYKRITFRDSDIKDIVSFDNELNNQELPLPKNPPLNEDNNIVFKGWTNFESRWDKPKKLYKTVSDVINASSGYYTIDLVPEWGTVDNIKKETKIIPIETKYIPNPELEPNKKEIENNGKEGQKEIVTTYQVTPITGELTNPSSTENIITPMQPKIIKVGTKPKIETIKNNNQTIERTTNYTVDEKTGELTETITDKLISINTPLISNPNEPNSPDNPDLNINEKPEYTGPVSTNTPVDDNGNLILPPVLDKPEFNRGVNSIEPPVKDKPEYKGTLSTNTPIDENENPILPPIVENPEFNGSINSDEPPVENKPEYTEPVSTNTPVDNNGDLILPPTVNELPEYNENINSKEIQVNETSEHIVPSNNLTVNNKNNETTKEETKQEKERELPNTNSTSILTTLVSSVIGTLGLAYKSKRRK